MFGILLFSATTIQTFLSLLPSSCPLLLSYILLTAGPLRGPPVKNIQISRGPRPPGQGSRGPRRTPLARTLIFQGIMDVGLVGRTSKLKGEVTCSNLALVNIFTPLHWVQPWNKQKQLYKSYLTYWWLSGDEGYAAQWLKTSGLGWQFRVRFPHRLNFSLTFAR